MISIYPASPLYLPCISPTSPLQVLMISISVKGGPRTLNGKLFLVDLAG